MIDVVDSSNREDFHGGAEDIDAAMKAARAAFDKGPWPRMSGAARGAILRKMSDGVGARTDELTRHGGAG